MSSALRSTLQRLSRERFEILERRAKLLAANPESRVAEFDTEELDDVDRRLRALLPGVDVDMRSFVLAGGGQRRWEVPLRARELRAIGASARATLADKLVGDCYLSELSNAVPLLQVARVVSTSTGGDMAFTFVDTLPSAGDVVADGAAMTSGDPTFGVAHTSATFAYKRLISLSSETVTDSFVDVEGDLGLMLTRVNEADLSADLWGGDGSAAAQGLLAGPSAVTAAGASAVVYDDIVNLIAAIPARYWSSTSILMSQGCAIDLFGQTLGTSAAGGQALQPTTYIGRINNFPCFVDQGLEDPATTVKTAVAGSFRDAYLIRLMPVRIETDDRGATSTDMVRLRVVTRGDGRRQNMDALRVLQMA